MLRPSFHSDRGCALSSILLDCAVSAELRLGWRQCRRPALSKWERSSDFEHLVVNTCGHNLRSSFTVEGSDLLLWVEELARVLRRHARKRDVFQWSLALSE